MAYNHMVLVFTTPVIGVFDLDKLQIEAYFTSTVGCSGPTQERKLTMVNVQNPTTNMVADETPLNRQVLIEFDEAFNNALGKIRVVYKSGLIGMFGEPVAPFVHEYLPDEMPYRHEPSAVETANLGILNNKVKTNAVETFATNWTEDVAALETVTTISSITAVTYVGQIKP